MHDSAELHMQLVTVRVIGSHPRDLCYILITLLLLLNRERRRLENFERIAAKNNNPKAEFQEQKYKMLNSSVY